jgi:hypothetical protein
MNQQYCLCAALNAARTTENLPDVPEKILEDYAVCRYKIGTYQLGLLIGPTISMMCPSGSLTTAARTACSGRF